MGDEENTVRDDAAEMASKSVRHKRAGKRKSSTPQGRQTVQSPKHEVRKEAESKESSGIPTNLIIAAVAVLLVLGGLVYVMSKERGAGPAATNVTTTTVPAALANASDAAQNGDIVAVDYTGTFENGTVFDTSILSVAQDNGIYNPVKPYEPLQFTLGYGGLIKGFEEAIVGMKVQETKEFTLPPEKAYGYPSAQLIDMVPRIQKSPIVQNVSREQFLQDIGQEPTVGLVFTLQNKSAYELAWPMKVLELYNDTVKFRFLPSGKTTIQTVFGPADVYGQGEEIIIEINATVGQKIVTRVGPAKIIAVNDQNVTVDFNSDLAGKTLNFKVQLASLVKQQ